MGLSRGGHNLGFIIETDSIGYGCAAKLAMKIIAIANLTSVPYYDCLPPSPSKVNDYLPEKIPLLLSAH
jgi:hypothetical protein